MKRTNKNNLDICFISITRKSIVIEYLIFHEELGCYITSHRLLMNKESFTQSYCDLLF